MSLTIRFHKDKYLIVKKQTGEVIGSVLTRAEALVIAREPEALVIENESDLPEWQDYDTSDKKIQEDNRREK